MTSNAVRNLVISAIVLAGLALAIQPAGAHKAITSKYTYNDDVFPIFRDRCASCHVPGGIAPMSLMTYDDAFPWAESIRAELVAAHMPPWNADEGYGEIKRAHTLSPKELDVILTWATGGNPRGALDQKLPKVELKNEWKLGAPDLVAENACGLHAGRDKMEDSQEFTLPSGTTEARWVRAVDLLPGTPSIVRSATIFVKTRAARRRRRRRYPNTCCPVAPGQEASPTDGVAFKRRRREIGLRVHYKKTWQFEGKPLTDRSTVGIYFAPAGNTQELLSLPMDSPAAATGSTGQTVRFSRTLPKTSRRLRSARTRSRKYQPADGSGEA